MSFTENERLQYELANKAYLDTQRRIAELPEKEKKLFDSISKVDIGNYGVRCSVLLMIANVYNNSAINAFDMIFKLGFMKGGRSMKNKINRKDKANG